MLSSMFYIIQMMFAPAMRVLSGRWNYEIEVGMCRLDGLLGLLFIYCVSTRNQADAICIILSVSFPAN